MSHLAFLGNAASYHVRSWLPALAEAGLDVTLLSYVAPPEPVPGARFHRLEPPFSRGANLRYLDFLAGARPLRALLDDLGPDALLASYATNYGFLGARTGFRPLILQTWTADVTLYPDRGWKRWLFRPIVRWTLARADVITTDGAGLAGELRARFPEATGRVQPLPWGIRVADVRPEPGRSSEARRRWGFPEGAPLVTSPRGVSRWYRADVLLPALRRLLEHRPEAHVLVLTLEQDRTPAVQAELAALAGHPRARVVDRFLDPEEMRDVWAMTDVFVSASLHDGVSESILEGMVAGAIPVVSDNPSNRSFLPEGEAAVYVHGPGLEDWLETLGAVLAALPEWKARVAGRNRSWVAEHASVEATARRLAALVEGLVASSRNLS